MGTTMALGVPVKWAKQQNLLYPVGPGPGVVQHLSNAVYLRSSQFVEPASLPGAIAASREIASIDCR